MCVRGALLGVTVTLIVATMDFSQFELGAKMQACSERERKFVWFYCMGDENGRLNASEAARRAGYSDPANGDGNGSSAIRVRGHELMHRERVLAAIDEVGRKAFRGLLIPAVMATKALIDNDKHPDHAGVVKSTLSRLGLVERSGVDVNHTGEITVNHTDEAISDLRALLALNVPREKLVETFGHSGLERYEKMLAISDARQKTIEGTAEEVKDG